MIFSRKIKDNLGLCTICLDSLAITLSKQLLAEFSFIDIGLKQIGRYDKEVLSVQSLIDFKELPTLSLVKDSASFRALLVYFKQKLPVIKEAGITSAVFGSPGARKDIKVTGREIEARCFELIELFRNNCVKLYFEALPKQYSDILNNHDDLLMLHSSLDYGIHLDLATLLTRSDAKSWIDNNYMSIDRFHLSVPGYGTNFVDYEEIEYILDVLINSGKPGTIEIQNFNDIKDWRKSII
jgi:hypothetical protein